LKGINLETRKPGGGKSNQEKRKAENGFGFSSWIPGFQIQIVPIFLLS
jgi:hypothetical protein